MNEYLCTTTMTTISTAVGWGYWNQQYSSTTASSTTGNSWVQWNSIYVGAAAYAYAGAGQAPQSTREQLEAQRQADADREVRRVAEAKKLAKAKAQAEDLLKEHLNAKQRASFEKDKTFVIHTKRGVYKVTHEWSGNLLFGPEEGKWTERLCVHPAVAIPIADHMLIQKLMLEIEEDLLLKTANHTRLC